MRAAHWIAVALMTAGCTAGPDSDDSEVTDGTDLPTSAFEAFSRGVALPELPQGQLPVVGGLIDSGFAPRFLTSSDRTDFHRGLDFDAARGTPVVASLAGTVFRVQPTDGDTQSNRVILAHPVAAFQWHGETIDTLYTFHGQLDSIDVVEDQVVAAGDQVGTVGDTGGASKTHLHFEVRLGTHCTLTYSTDNPDSGCARSYDPAINPLHILPGRDSAAPDVTLADQEVFAVWVQSRLTDQDINRIESDLGAVDLDQREGIDATTARTLDNLEFGWMTIAPEPTASEGGRVAWKLEFEQQPAWLEVTDIRGGGVRWQANERSE